MIIISDTTPLRYLIEIEAAHILETLYGKITIPEKVFSELQGVNTPPNVTAWIQVCPEWIEVKQADTSLFTPQRNIHDGEREAIALAIELQADAFLSDDGNAIKEALRLNIPTVRLFTILAACRKKRLVGSLPRHLGTNPNSIRVGSGFNSTPARAFFARSPWFFSHWTHLSQ